MSNGVDFRKLSLDLREELNRVQAEYSSLLGEHEDLIEKFNNSGEAIRHLEQRRHAEQQACQAAERRVEELMETARGLVIQIHSSFGYTEHHPDCLRDLAALNPTAEAVSHVVYRPILSDSAKKIIDEDIDRNGVPK